MRRQRERDFALPVPERYGQNVNIGPTVKIYQVVQRFEIRWHRFDGKHFALRADNIPETHGFGAHVCADFDDRVALGTNCPSQRPVSPIVVAVNAERIAMEITGSTAKPGPGPGPDGEPEIVLESRFLGIDHGPYSHRCNRWHPATQTLGEPQAPGRLVR